MTRAALQNRTWSPPSPSFAPARTGMLQRKCACGGTPGPTGECAECRKKRLGRQAARSVTPPTARPFVNDGSRSPEQPPESAARSFVGSRFGHDFGKVRVWPDAAGERVATAEGCGSCEQDAAHQNDDPLATGELLEDLEIDHNLVNGLIATAADLPCFGRGGNSACNPYTGNYDIDYNDNNCCTRKCTQRHEERHVSDLQDCCRALHTKIVAGGNKLTLSRHYNTWMASGTLDWTECNAYTVSVDCLRGMWADGNCDRVCTQCCAEIQDHLASAEAQSSDYCGRAPESRAACPF